MEMMIDKKNGKNNLVLAVIAFAAVVVMIILISVLVIMLRENPYGKEIEIDNFGIYYGDAPQDIKDKMFSELYDIVEYNLNEPSEIPKRGAFIRDGEAINNYDEAQNLHVGRFIVDVPEMKMSFQGYFEWTNSKNNSFLSGYQAIYTCPPSDVQVYEGFSCRDMFEDDLATKYPIILNLPIKVEYYSDDYSKYTKYEIRYDVNSDLEKLKLVVLDYTGGNYEKSLGTIRELGFDPENFEIEYNDQSSQNAWPYVGNQ